MLTNSCGDFCALLPLFGWIQDTAVAAAVEAMAEETGMAVAIGMAVEVADATEAAEATEEVAATIARGTTTGTQATVTGAAAAVATTIVVVVAVTMIVIATGEGTGIVHHHQGSAVGVAGVQLAGLEGGIVWRRGSTLDNALFAPNGSLCVHMADFLSAVAGA